MTSRKVPRLTVREFMYGLLQFVLLLITLMGIVWLAALFYLLLLLSTL